MNCKKCGSPVTENDQFCKNCGAALNTQNEASNAPVIVGGQNLAPQPSSPEPAWANSYNPNPNYQPPKSSGNLKYIIIGVVAVVVVIAAAVAITLLSNKKDDDKSSNKNSNTSENSNANSNDEDDNSGSSNNSSSGKFYKVNLDGFTFSIPDDLVYKQQGDALTIGDEEGTWLAQLELAEGSFSQIKSKKSQLQSTLQTNGYNCTAAVEKTIGGVEFITMEIDYSGTNAILAFAKANAMYFVGITAFNEDNEIDYKLLEKIAPIIDSIELASDTNKISPNMNIDIDMFSQFAI